MKVVGTGLDRSLRVCWALEEMDVDYDLIFAKPGSDQAKKYNPTGKVPALILDGKTYTDSVAIMTFMADRESKFTFQAGTADRMVQDGHIQFLNEEFDALLWTAAKQSFVNPPEQRVPEIKPILKWEFDRSLSRLENRLKGDFLMGDKMTIADIMAVHCLNWAFSAKFSKPSQVLLNYSKRLRSRPAYQRAIEKAKSAAA